MGTFRFLIWAVVALFLVMLALANRQIVNLKLFPDSIGEFTRFNPSVEVPLFIAIFVGVGIGLLLGLIAEWVREGKHRKEARMQRKEATTLRKEVDALKQGNKDTGDDVLALVD